MKAVPYRVLIVDDSQGEFGFGESAQLELRNDANFEIDLAFSVDEAWAKLAENLYDIFVVDVYIHKHQEGVSFTKRLREQGFSQPIILATDNPKELEQPIYRYEGVLRDGPTFFYQKSYGETSTADVIRRAAERSDVLLRTLRQLVEAGAGDQRIQMGDEEFSIVQLMAAYRSEGDRPGVEPSLLKARRALRDSLSHLAVRMA